MLTDPQGSTEESPESRAGLAHLVFVALWVAAVIPGVRATAPLAWPYDFDHFRDIAAACAFLFLPHRPPAWASATYSPWLFPSIPAQALLYVGIAQ